MADEQTTPVATTEVPVEAPEQQAPAQPEPQAPEAPAEPQQRLPRDVRAEARRAAREKYKHPARTEATESAPAGETEQPKIDAQGRTHDPATGKYLPEQGEEAATQQDGSQPEAAPTAEASSEPATPDASATQQVPEGHVRIEVPEALQRNFGREKIVPEADAEFARWSFNNAVRNREIEEAQRQVAEARAEAARARAEAEVFRDPAADPLADPAVRQKYTEILQAWGEEDAQAYLRGQDKRGEAAQAKAAELERNAKLDAAAETFKAQWLPRSMSLFEAWKPYGEDFIRMKLARPLYEFSQRVDRGEAPPDVGKFLDDYAIPAYTRDPLFQQWLAKKKAAEKETLANQARQQAEQEAREKEEARLKEAADRRATQHPMGRIPSNVRTDRQTTSGAEPEYDPTGKSPDQIKKDMRRRAHARVPAV